MTEFDRICAMGAALIGPEPYDKDPSTWASTFKAHPHLKSYNPDYDKLDSHIKDIEEKRDTWLDAFQRAQGVRDPKSSRFWEWKKYEEEMRWNYMQAWNYWMPSILESMPKERIPNGMPYGMSFGTWLAMAKKESSLEGDYFSPSQISHAEESIKIAKDMFRKAREIEGRPNHVP